MQIMTAGYAGLVGSDPTAYDAARSAAIEAKEDGPKGAAERMAAGMFAYNGGSWSQTANAKQRFQLAMYNHAVEGSQAYVGMQPGNEYTQYLNDRYGPMTPEKQAFGTCTTVNAASRNPPGTGLISLPPRLSFRTLHSDKRYVESGSCQPQRPEVSALVAWCRYPRMSLLHERYGRSELPTGTDPMVRDAYVGRAAQMMSPAVVSTCAALAMEVDEGAAADVAPGQQSCQRGQTRQTEPRICRCHKGYSTATRVAAAFALRRQPRRRRHLPEAACRCPVAAAVLSPTPSQAPVVLPWVAAEPTTNRATMSRSCPILAA
ncbi:MAG: hypothetical protein R3C24_05885 [Cyanobacteriota/Melainabacteria group bacterium]